jgi:hypothetical protein
VDIFVERLLLELAAILLQMAIAGVVRWVHCRPAPSSAGLATI